MLNYSPETSRRRFLTASSLLGLAACTAGARTALARPDDKPAAPPDTGSFPRQPLDLVQAVVGASHGNLERVRELVTARPALAKCAWDWGFGDWESPIGAAADTGRREIALFLIDNGARPDIFTFAMLGQLAAVKAYVETQPGVQRIHGPHGIPLLRHAQAGGAQAAEVFEYLKSLGDAGPEYVNRPLDAALAAYTGKYQVEGPAPFTFEIKEAKGQLAFQREPQPARTLFHQGDNAFHPAGAPAVRITFEISAGRCSAVTISDQQTHRAERVQ